MRIAVAAIVALAASGILSAADRTAPNLLTRESVVEATLTAPLSELFAGAERDEDYHVIGKLSWRDDESGREIVLDGLSISTRGHTSRQASECSFPKLKLDFSKTPHRDAPLDGLRALKIGTHCGDRPDDELTRKYGRLANEHAPLREALVYQMLHAAQVTTLRARPARITYIFTDDPGRAPLTRGAMLLEDDDDAQERLGGTASIEETAFGSARDQFDVHDTARLAFAQAMIGNFDWCLRMFRGDIYRCDDRHPLWNVLAFTQPGGRATPLIYDFDLAGPVVGRHVWFKQVFDAAFVDPASTIQVEVQAQVQRTRSLFDRSVLDRTRAEFMQARGAVEATIERSSADATGKDLAHRYTTAFFDAIADDRSFYRPIVVEGGHPASLDPDGAQPACGQWSGVPAGTPVSAAIETRGSRSRVRILDALWQWTGSFKCDAIHTQPVWIDTAAIGTEYPR